MGDSVTFRVGGRRSGKSTKLLDWLAEAMVEESAVQYSERKEVIVVSANRQHSDMLYRMAKDRHIDVLKDQFITIDEAMRGGLRGMKARVGMDESQYILQLLCNHQLEFLTATGELDETPNS
jgi:hypothetical protein